MHLALKLTFAALAAVLLVWMIETVADDPRATHEATDAAVRAFHDGLCQDPRGTLADGSCE